MNRFTVQIRFGSTRISRRGKARSMRTTFRFAEFTYQLLSNQFCIFHTWLYCFHQCTILHSNFQISLWVHFSLVKMMTYETLRCAVKPRNAAFQLVAKLAFRRAPSHRPCNGFHGSKKQIEAFGFMSTFRSFYVYFSFSKIYWWSHVFFSHFFF